MNRIKSNIKKLRNWLNSHPKVSFGLVGIGILIFAGLTYAVATQLKTEFKEAPDIKITKRNVKYYSPLTGVKVKNEAATTQLVTAIMIENSPDARPHSGLKQAGVVYEAIAEGGITRYVALYQQDKPKLVGPVRSLRPYYLDWITPYNPSIAHVGGSAKALKAVRNSKYRDIDQFFNPDTYWRASDRYAPHNVYTSFSRLDKLNKQKGFKTSNFKSFDRVDPKPAKKPDATNIKIDFSSPEFNTKYIYNKNKNNYTRYVGGEVHKDREKGPITPTVVVAIEVSEQTFNEDGPRERITTTGSGKATILQNGTVIEAKWRKIAVDKPLELIDKAGKPIALVRGQTWIAAIPSGRGSVSW